MIDTLTSTPFFGLGLTLLCWFLAVKLQKRTGLLVCNPVLVAAMLVIAVMVVFRIPLENYNAGGDIIKMLLAPATAVLAALWGALSACWRCCCCAGCSRRRRRW